MTMRCNTRSKFLHVSIIAIYARLNLDPIRESMNKATDAMFTAGLVSKEAHIAEV
jgi:hypothetical protein